MGFDLFGLIGKGGFVHRLNINNLGHCLFHLGQHLRAGQISTSITLLMRIIGKIEQLRRITGITHQFPSAFRSINMPVIDDQS